ncbi:MAG: HAD-IA family hydrolase [Pseudorhodoplanes sp.]
MTLRALIFDVDGTLADTEEAHREAFNLAFAEHGLTWNWNRRLYENLLKTAGGKERIRFFIRSLELPEAEATALFERVAALHASKTKHYAARLMSGGLPVRPGITRLLHDARESGLRLAIASTTTRSNIDALLSGTFGVEAFGWFDAIACGDQAARKKPAPDVYELALSRLKLESVQCAAFEDSANGVTAAKAAGLFVVASPTLWTARDDLSAADLQLRGFDEPHLLQIVESRHATWLSQHPEAA